MSQNFELVIFDNDGVLVNSEHAYLDFWPDFLKDYDIEIDATYVEENFMGTKSIENIKKVFAEFAKPLPDLDVIHGQYNDALEAKMPAFVTAMPGVKEAVSSITLPKCVASSASKRSLGNKQKWAGVQDLFEDDQKFTSDMEMDGKPINGKPAPDIFILAARENGIEPEKCVVIEDSIFGVQAAKAAGMYAIGFVGGEHIEDKDAFAEKLKAVGADVVIEHMDELTREIEMPTGLDERRLYERCLDESGEIER